MQRDLETAFKDLLFSSSLWRFRLVGLVARSRKRPFPSWKRDVRSDDMPCVVLLY